VPESGVGALSGLARRSRTAVTRIGRIEAGSGVAIETKAGPIEAKGGGYSHF
jgi:thiamine monophosphate kinase